MGRRTDIGNEVRIKATVDDKVSGPLAKIHDKFDVLGKNPGFKAVAQGVGIGAGAAAFGLLGGAIGGVTDFLGDSVKAYQEEQKSVAQLDASLKANVAGYDGNRDAIEKVLTARMRLGFSDEEQRASLARLVAATHDSNKALEVQRTAMDLARFKGISLSDATDALTKVEAGSFRVLKSLGIELKAGATAQDALTAVQRVATGQAEAYANTNEGKVLASQIKVNEAEEKFGKVLSKLEAEILPVLADAVGAVADAFDALGIGSEKSMAEVQKAVDEGNYGARAKLNSMKAAADKAAEGMVTAFEGKRGAIGFAATEAATPIAREFKKASAIAVRTVKFLPGELAFDLRSGYDAINSASTALGEALKNPIKQAARERALQDILDGKGSVGRRLVAGLKSSDPLVVQAAQKLKTDVLTELAALRSVTLNVNAQVSYNTPKGKHVRALAGGGHYDAGEPRLTGEYGPELDIPDHSGTVVPLAHGGGGTPAGSGHPHVVQLVVSRRVLAELVLDETSYGRGNPTFAPS